MTCRACRLARTDAGPPNFFPDFNLHDELALVVKAGLAPHEALRAAARNTAWVVGLGDELGTVEVGKLPDLLLLDADPLTITVNTTRIATVITESSPGAVVPQWSRCGRQSASRRRISGSPSSISPVGRNPSEA